jgi:catechol 2,3-dioxygenase-like lactoylglutathione lyase family enzyme
MNRIPMTVRRMMRRIGPDGRRLTARSVCGRVHSTAPSDVEAARAFYGDALLGRQLRRPARCGTTTGLWFLISGNTVEVRTGNGGAAAPVVIDVDDPDLLAQRCWDAGFTVRVGEDETGRAPVSVIDPFGRRLDLMPKAALHDRLSAGGAGR